MMAAFAESGLVALDWTSVGYALALLAVAIILLVLEIFIVSMGLLAFLAIGCAAGAVYFAFVAHDGFGWGMVVAIPLLGTIIVRWGLGRIQRSSIVPKTEIAAEAGYHHTTDRLGISVGSVGEMVTPAHPSGRARFEQGECDVRTPSGSLERGETVVVTTISGPVVEVRAMETEI
jgi:membrane-bound ClpP family serine protease